MAKVKYLSKSRKKKAMRTTGKRTGGDMRRREGNKGGGGKQKWRECEDGVELLRGWG